MHTLLLTPRDVRRQPARKLLLLPACDSSRARRNEERGGFCRLPGLRIPSQSHYRSQNKHAAQLRCKHSVLRQETPSGELNALPLLSLDS